MGGVGSEPHSMDGSQGQNHRFVWGLDTHTKFLENSVESPAIVTIKRLDEQAGIGLYQIGGSTLWTRMGPHRIATK